MNQNCAGLIIRTLRTAIPWLLICGLLALMAADLDAPYLAIGSACLAVAVLLLLCGFAIRSTDRWRRRYCELEARCSHWTCPYCGQVYGPDSVFQPYRVCESAQDRWANVWCAHCDRLNVYAKDGARLFGGDEPMPELCQRLRAGKEERVCRNQLLRER